MEVQSYKAEDLFDVGYPGRTRFYIAGCAQQ